VCSDGGWVGGRLNPTRVWEMDNTTTDLTSALLQVVLGHETVHNVSSTAYPGAYPGIDDSFSLSSFAKVSVGLCLHCLYERCWLAGGLARWACVGVGVRL
jgi:hypothetical protein